MSIIRKQQQVVVDALFEQIERTAQLLRYIVSESVSPTLMKKGIDTFGSREHFLAWMISPITALGGKKPYEFSEEEIMNELGRIDYGVYS
jgi:uncharacterized protein (DUF2384 family)